MAAETDDATDTEEAEAVDTGPDPIEVAQRFASLIKLHGQLLGAVAKSPAMLYYLDNWQSVADSGRPTLGNERPMAQALRRRAAQRAAQNGTPGMPAVAALANRKRGLNENYARELMELHTLGVDGGYTQADVVEVARAFTG